MRKRKLYWVLGGVLAAIACVLGVQMGGSMTSDDGLGGRDNNAAAPHVGPDCVPTGPSAKGRNSVSQAPNTGGIPEATPTSPSAKGKNSVGQASNKGVIPEATATRLAREACKGRLEIPDHSPVKAELEGDCYVITFLCVPPLRGPGPDHYAKVWVDKRSGKIRRLLAGS